MSLILKQEPANTIATPPAGKSTLFVTDNSVMAVKSPDGNVTTFPTVQGANTQVLFNDDGALNGNANLVFNKTSATMTVTNLSVTGNLNAGDINVSSIANGTSNVDIIGASGNVTTSVAGTANVLVVTATGANITGTLSASGNINAGNVAATTFTGALSGAATSATTAGTVTTSAQPNITSVGTLTSLSVSGNVTGANLVVGLNGKVYSTEIIDGGTGIYLAAGPSGYINFFTTGGDKASISDTGNIIASNVIANSTVFATTANISGYVNAGNVVTGGTISSTGTATLGNVTTGGTITSTGTATLGNITTGGTITSTGTATLGNVSTSGFVSATGNVTAGSITTAGNVSAGNISASGVINVTGNVTGGNISTAGAVNATGDISGGNVFATLGEVKANTANIVSLLVANVISATGNVIGANLFTPGIMTATGNITAGNLGTAGLVVATGNVSGGNLTTGGLVSATGNIVSNANVVTDLIAGRTTSVTITAAGTNQNINLVPTGTGFVNVGNFIISNVATPVSSTDAATKQYVDDVAQGLHTHDSCNAATQTTLASISGGVVTYNNGTSGVGATLTTTGTFTTIDGVTLSNGMRILVKDEVTTANNGIYVRTSATVLTRADDFNTPTEMAGGDFTFVTAGTLYDNTGWVMPDPVTTVGTSPVVWVQFSGAGTYTAGTGLTLTGSQFSITNTAVTAGAYGNGDYNATFTVNGQGQLTAAANVAITANAGNLSGTVLKSTIVTSSLTSVGTLTSLSISGNANIGNVGATAGIFSTIAGSLTTATQGNITSLGTLSSLSVSGNANVGNIGATNLVGTLTTGSQTNITAVGTLASLSVTGNITTSANVTGTHYGAATGLTGIVGANVTGTVANATFATSAGSATTAGTVTTAAQPNITSVGTLTSLSSSGNVTAGNLITGGLITVTGNVTGGNLVSTGSIGGTGATHLGNTFTTGANTTVGTVTGNFALSAGSRFQATYA